MSQDETKVYFVSSLLFISPISIYIPNASFTPFIFETKSMSSSVITKVVSKPGTPTPLDCKNNLSVPASSANEFT